MKRMLFLLIFTATLFPISLFAQDTQKVKFSNNFDLIQVGIAQQNSNNQRAFAGLVFGYHFTTVELGRLNTLGLGIGYVVAHRQKSFYGTNKAQHDLALTTSQSVRLNKRGLAEDPTVYVYFNLTYAYHLVNQRHGLYFGFSLGS